METILSIAHWNKKQFRATEQQQRDKIKEEFGEFMTDKSLEEFVDTLIAIIGLARHNRIWKQLFGLVLELGNGVYSREEVINAIQLKMEINRSRVWEGQHHIEKIQ